jgi:aldehyde:ferredoxin oxidoreductase
MGKLLRVDLARETIAEELLPPGEVLRAYVGGTGLGVWLLVHELPGGVTRATDPATPLIFTTGPLTGTIIPTAADLTIVSLNFETGYTVATAHTHGFVAPHLKRAGYDGLIVTGSARRIHPDAETLLVHVKGSGFNLHDWRINWAVLLGQCVSQAGGCWQGGGMVDFYGDPDLGYPGPRPIAVRDGTPEAVRKSQLRRLWEDSIGVCLFSLMPPAPGTLALTARAVAAATGWQPLTAEEALRIGERIINLERLFSVHRGRSLRHDLDVGPKLLEAPKDGKAKGIALGPHLRAMVQEYYALMGWDPDTGAPLPATLARLGLQGFAGP